MPANDDKIQEAYANLAQSTADEEHFRKLLSGAKTLDERFSIFFDLATRFIKNEGIHANSETVTVPTTAQDAAKYIDHTLLKLDATEQQIDKLCDEAKEYAFKVIHYFCWTNLLLTDTNRLFVFAWNGYNTVSRTLKDPVCKWHA
ncbi:hypothetical protein LTS18_015054 [Coniosporium uncinatum]|uniref:Uncharacterized protein n=1 Tax=Coniosporium uncinatum TaxID=93489 RepID=A0ACC3DG82_9PEZI|nr:hypothetical protein LTS18_015054 [Coniosporium uncinatum]